MHNVTCSSLSLLDMSFLIHPWVSFCCSFGYIMSVPCGILEIHQYPIAKLWFLRKLLVPLDCIILLLPSFRGNPIVSVFLVCSLTSHVDSWSSANFISKFILCQLSWPNRYVEGGFRADSQGTPVVISFQSRISPLSSNLHHFSSYLLYGSCTHPWL